MYWDQYFIIGLKATIMCMVLATNRQHVLRLALSRCWTRRILDYQFHDGEFGAFFHTAAPAWRWQSSKPPEHNGPGALHRNVKPRDQGLQKPSGSYLIGIASSLTKISQLGKHGVSLLQSVLPRIQSGSLNTRNIWKAGQILISIRSIFWGWNSWLWKLALPRESRTCCCWKQLTRSTFKASLPLRSATRLGGRAWPAFTHVSCQAKSIATFSMVASCSWTVSIMASRWHSRALDLVSFVWLALMAQSLWLQRTLGTLLVMLSPAQSWQPSCLV